MTPPPVHRLRALLAAALLAAAALPVPAARTAAAEAPTELFFSEYVEGSSNNKALEIFNGTASAVDLAAGHYNVFMSFNGGTSTLTIALTGTVASGDVYVVAQASAAAPILAQADQTNTAGWFNGDDAVQLRRDTTIVDAIGQAGFDPGTEWGSGLTSTADNTLRRKGSVRAGDPNAFDAFDPALEWDGFATDTFDGLGSHVLTADLAPTVVGTFPADGSTTFPIDADLTVSFSEPVDVVDPWFTLACSTSGTVTTTVSGGPTTFTLNPTATLADGETCTLTILADRVTDQDGDDPPDNMAVDFTADFTANDVCADPFTPIPDIQGSGATVALTGTRTTQGVVVGDYEGPSPALRGFFLEDPVGDGDPATSDGIFVFEGSNADTVNVGDVVRVTGTAGENQGQSQVSVGTIVHCGSGTVGPTDVTFPIPSADALERFEGMLVRLPQTMVVTEHFQLARFGQVVLSAETRLRQPTSVVAPGAPAADLQAQNDLRKIILDDALQSQNPDPIAFGRGDGPLTAANTLRGGDTATGIVGVMTYTWAGNSASGNAFRVRPIGALGGSWHFDASNPRTDTAPNVHGTLRVAGMNLLNFFNTFDGVPDTVDNCTNGVGGLATDCRGADTTAEFDRQWPKTVAEILRLDADVVGINEIENDGYGASSAIQFLVDRLNAATSPGTWAFIDADAGTGQVNALGTDAIKVGMLYRPAAVTPVGTTAALNSEAFVNGGDSAPRSRPSLAQAFEDNATGARVIVDINHLKSKGSACDAPDAGDGQGNCNAVRTNAANALLDWLATDPTGTGDPDVLLVGDYNSYAKEDPIAALEAGGLTNLIADRIGDDAYSYVFDGQWGYLDYAFGSPSLLDQVTGVGEDHVNADEPSALDYNTDFKTPNLRAVLYAPDEFRVSDHDPVLVGLRLNADPVVSSVSAAPTPVALGATVTASAAFTDGNADDAHTAVIDWGDGTTSAGTVTEAAGSGTVSGTHAYAATGFYDVTVTVTDPAEASDSATFSTVVVYDPNGRPTTGSGWISSPAGAYAPNPTASGKATFDLDVKYLKGAGVPAGTATFQLPAAGFSFAATAYDWLVVSGSMATLQGTGTVNGSGTFTFRLRATDDSPDRLRLQVWAEGGALVYDNGSDQALGGGSIVIRPSK